MKYNVMNYNIYRRKNAVSVTYLFSSILFNGALKMFFYIVC